MNMGDQALAAEIMNTTLCRTDSPATAAAVLMTAVAHLLEPGLRREGTVGVLRGIIDDVERAMQVGTPTDPAPPASPPGPSSDAD